MKYDVQVAGRHVRVEVDGDRVRVGGRVVAASLALIPPGPLYRLELDGRSRTFAITRSKEGLQVHGLGMSWQVDVLDERREAVQKLGRAAHAPADGAVRAPMPGLVLRLEVEEGQAVSAGTGLVVLEAMKMENEIRAPVAGVVHRVLVTQGQAVDRGAPLVELRSAG